MKNKGFTIIELIVVIAIIAVLAGIVLVNVTQYIQKANVSAIMADLNQISVEATDYYSKNGNFDNIRNDTKMQNIINAINNIGGYDLHFYDHTGNYDCTTGDCSDTPYVWDGCNGVWMFYIDNDTTNTHYCASSNGVVGTYVSRAGCNCWK